MSVKSFVWTLFIFLSLIVATSTSSAGPPVTAFTYQGKLTDSEGQPLTGKFYMSFRLYSAATGGEQIGTTIVIDSVLVDKGLFTVPLDFGAEVFRVQPLWLETKVEKSILSPRSQITAVPFAVSAQTAPWSGVIGAPISLPPSGSAGGDLTGTYPNPSLATSATSLAKVSGGVMTSSNNMIGIGTATPADKLDVRGNIRALASASPTLIGSLTYTGYPYRLAVAGRFLYIATGGPNTLQVVDVSNPTNPFALGSAVLDSHPEGIAVAGRYVYVTTQNLLNIYSVHDPANPTFVGSIAAAPYSSFIKVEGNYAYVCSASSQGKVQVFDITNPASPSLAGSKVVTSGGCTHGFAISGKFAYVADWCTDAMTIWDISNPVAITQVGSVATTSRPHAVVVLGRYAYLANQGTGSFQVVDVSNPANPVVASTLIPSGFPTAIAVSGRYAYLVTEQNYDLNLLTIDVINPSSPTIVSTGRVTGANWPQTGAMVVSGRYAYTAVAGFRKLQVLDVTGIETTALTAHSLEADNLQVRGSAVVGDTLSVRSGLNVGGSGFFAGKLSANAVALTSDLRFKTGVQTLTGALETVGKLRGVTYNWNRHEFSERNFGDGRQIGFIAQEVEKVLPELVMTDDQGYRAVEYQNLIPVLVEAIKEQQKQIEELKKQIADMEKE